LYRDRSCTATIVAVQHKFKKVANVKRLIVRTHWTATAMKQLLERSKRMSNFCRKLTKESLWQCQG